MEKTTNYRGLFPGTFTMGNVVCGFVAILNSFNGEYLTACWFICLAAFLDALDGKVARLSGSTSQFGVELDSLADFLSFGVAPAVLVYTIKLKNMGEWGWLIAIVYIMAQAYRLARYNILADSDEKKNFIGMPVPIAAVTIVTFIIFSYEVWGQLEYSEVLVSMVILFSFLMVSQIQFDTLPERIDTPQAKIKLIFMVLSVIIILFNYRLLLFPFMVLYILFCITREVYRLVYVGVEKVAGPYRRRTTDKEENDE